LNKGVSSISRAGFGCGVDTAGIRLGLKEKALALRRQVNCDMQFLGLQSNRALIQKSIF